MTATEPLDPAAIMAEHRRPNLGSWCIVCWDGEDDRSGDWPCLPYRLAADLAEANHKLAAVSLDIEAAWDRGYADGGVDRYYEVNDRPNPYRTALGGDHA